MELLVEPPCQRCENMPYGRYCPAHDEGGDEIDIQSARDGLGRIAIFITNQRHNRQPPADSQLDEMEAIVRSAMAVLGE